MACRVSRRSELGQKLSLIHPPAILPFQVPTAPKTRQSKYNAVKCKKDGFTFDSKKELARYEELKTLKRGKQIKNLEVHPSIPLVVNGQVVCVYKPDFRYHENQKGKWVSITEDVKGVKTAVYRLKKKLLQALLGVTIRET